MGGPGIRIGVRTRAGGVRAGKPPGAYAPTVAVVLQGHTVHFTLRDHDEHRLLARLDALLQRCPAPQAAAAGPACQWHGPMKPSTKAAGTSRGPSMMRTAKFYNELRGVWKDVV